jgi:hypothetical protein
MGLGVNKDDYAFQTSPLRLSPWLAELTSWPANEAITGEVLIPHSGQGHGKDEAGSTLVRD